MANTTVIGTETIVGREGFLVGDGGGGCVEQEPGGVTREGDNGLG